MVELIVLHSTRHGFQGCRIVIKVLQTEQSMGSMPVKKSLPREWKSVKVLDEPTINREVGSTTDAERV